VRHTYRSQNETRVPNSFSPGQGDVGVWVTVCSTDSVVPPLHRRPTDPTTHSALVRAMSA